MSHYIVLVKQVPDVTKITDNAFDPETGNLMRGTLPTVINELDAQALAFADRMRSLDPNPGQMIALTMGPPMAEEVLRYCLARVADQAILLTDRILGGADTWATANPLAFAIRKIARDLMQKSDDYFIIAGMQSVDGDTAQVPAQIAEELEMPIVAYATDVARENNRFHFTRIISGGSQVVACKKLPAVVTVAKYEHTLFTTFAKMRRANHAELITWNADDIQASAVGVKGSKTRVIRVFPPPKTSRKCREIKDVQEFAQVIIDSYKNNGENAITKTSNQPEYILPPKRNSLLDRRFEGTIKENEAYKYLVEMLQSHDIQDPAKVTQPIKEDILAKAGKKVTAHALEAMLQGLHAVEPMYQGDVWVVAEHEQKQINPASYELIGKARDLADSLETQVGVVLVGKNVEPMAQSLIQSGADNVYLFEHDLLEEFDPKAYRKAIAEVIKTYQPQIVLYAATPQGRVLAPMVSYRLNCGLTADCTSLQIHDNSRKGEIAFLLQTRPALGGNVMASICTKDSRIQMATARPGVMKRRAIDEKRTGKIIPVSLQLSESDICLDIIRQELGGGEVNFDADIIVSGGRGISGKEDFRIFTRNLSEAIRKRLDADVEIGASRAAVEQGYIERIHQVGQTGTAIKPRLYLAMAISGAIQHMIGVANSETILAINSDPQAPIFRNADYYIVGNVENIIPQLVQTLGEN